MDDSISVEEEYNVVSPAPAIDRHHLPLIPDDYASYQEAAENFLRVYEFRYGEVHPIFYPGSLEDAITESCNVKATQRKPLLIYLHDDASVSANVFATQVLCTQAVTDFLNHNFTVWAWDCTLQENKNKFLLSLSTNLDSSVAYGLRRLEHDQYPVLLFVYKARGSFEVEQLIKAPCSLDELMEQLIHAFDTFTHQNRLDIIDEEEREARKQVRSEQEIAYQASLNADRIKAEQKRLEEERQQNEQRIKDEEAALQEKERRLLAEQLPPEPPESARSMTVRFRLPTAEIVERRFLKDERLSTVLKFAASKGYNWDNYRLLTSYPKRDLNLLDASQTLEKLQFSPREIITVEEK